MKIDILRCLSRATNPKRQFLTRKVQEIDLADGCENTAHENFIFDDFDSIF